MPQVPDQANNLSRVEDFILVYWREGGGCLLGVNYVQVS